jgi:poly(A) polymerase
MSDTLSPKIGGRIVSPKFPVVDGSPSTSALEKSFDESLQVYVKENVPLESIEGIQRRERILNQMGSLSRDWIRSVCVKRELSKEVVDSAGGQLFTSGSYRLGVHEPGADIDTILVVPNVCTKQHFFGTIPSVDENDPEQQNMRDLDSLAERIRRHPDVTNFVPIEGAAVPVLTFDWEGVNIDLLFARLIAASVPPGFDIDKRCSSGRRRLWN